MVSEGIESYLMFDEYVMFDYEARIYNHILTFVKLFFFWVFLS